MKLEHLVNSCIYLYPTLYRANTYEESRLLVLDHIFLHYGTGLEWSPKGFIADLIGYTKKDEPIFGISYPIKKLPDNYFDMNLWYMDILKKDLPKIKKELGKNYYYTRPAMNDTKKGIEIVFEATDEFAEELTRKYEHFDEGTKASRERFREIMKRDLESHAHKAISSFHDKAPVYQFKNYQKSVYTPGDMCRYSPIVEMLNGRTNSPHIDNFELTYIQPDILAGAIEIARYALNFYRNPDNHKHCYRHPDNCMHQFPDFKKDPNKWRADRKGEPGMTDDMTPERWCVICWENDLKEQMGYLEGFLNKYDKETT